MAPKPADPLSALDVIGSSLLKEALPASAGAAAATLFHKPERQTLNQMKQQQRISETAQLPAVAAAAAPKAAATLTAAVPAAASVTAAQPETLSDNCNTSNNVNGNDAENIAVKASSQISSNIPDAAVDVKLKSSNQSAPTSDTNGVNSAPDLKKSKPQLMEVKPMNDLRIPLEDIKPSK